MSLVDVVVAESLEGRVLRLGFETVLIDTANANLSTVPRDIHVM